MTNRELVIKSLWHKGDEEPQELAMIVMINTTGKYLGKYHKGNVVVWAGCTRYFYAFTPRCRWAYLRELRGQKQ